MFAIGRFNGFRYGNLHNKILSFCRSIHDRPVFILVSAPKTHRQFRDMQSDLIQTGIHEFSTIHNEKFQTRTFHCKHPVYKYLKMRFFFNIFKCWRTDVWQFVLFSQYKYSDLPRRVYAHLDRGHTGRAKTHYIRFLFFFQQSAAFGLKRLRHKSGRVGGLKKKKRFITICLFFFSISYSSARRISSLKICALV